VTEIIIFQCQTHVKQNAEIVLKLFQCFISHVTTDRCNHCQWLHV